MYNFEIKQCVLMELCCLCVSVFLPYYNWSIWQKKHAKGYLLHPCPQVCIISIIALQLCMCSMYLSCYVAAWDLCDTPGSHILYMYNTAIHLRICLANAISSGNTTRQAVYPLVCANHQTGWFHNDLFHHSGHSRNSDVTCSIKVVWYPCKFVLNS